MSNDTNVTFERSLLTVCTKHGFIECEFAMWLLRTIPLMLLMIGTFGNVMSLAVLVRRRMRMYTTTVYLLFLCVSDTTVLWTALFRMTLLRLFDVDVRNWSWFHCTIMQWVSLTAAGFSIWILVIMTIERIFRVKRPTQAKVMCVPKNALKITVVTLVIIAVSTGHLLFGFRIQDLAINSNASHEVDTEHTKQCVHSSSEYSTFYKGPWMMMVGLISNIIPMAIIITGNALIAITLKIQSRRKSTHKEAVLSSKECSAIKLLFILCAFFVLTTSPYNVYRIVKNKFDDDFNDETYVKLKLASVVVHCLVWSNFAFNFILYFVSGSLFKKEWKRLVNEISEKLGFKCLYSSDREKQSSVNMTSDGGRTTVSQL